MISNYIQAIGLSSANSNSGKVCKMVMRSMSKTKKSISTVESAMKKQMYGGCTQGENAFWPTRLLHVLKMRSV